MNTLYTNGMIAVREKSLLGDRLLRLAGMGAEEAFRALRESGFGSGAEAVSARDGEALCMAETLALDDFVREYAPSRAVAEYLLLPRDHHNAKALVKAQRLHTDGEKLLAPAGLLPVEQLSSAIEEGNYAALGALSEPVKRAMEEDLTGAELGFLFDRALYERLRRVCRHSPLLTRLVTGRIDRLNLLTVLRAGDREEAEKLLLPGGRCSVEELFSGPEDGELLAFYRLALSAKERGGPFVEAERALDSFETLFLAAHRYELEGKEPFLYYVLRRRAEIANVRILLVCLSAGVSEGEIRRRLRAI